MTNAVTNNLISAQNVVLWQYDKAVKFCAIVSLIEDWGKKCTQALWDYFVERVHGLFTLTGTTQQELAAKIDDYSLALWGILAGLSRPSLTVSGTTAPMSKILYRKVLAARLKLMQTNGSLRDISQYCEDIFGTSKVTVSDGLDMSITYALSSATALDADAELKALYQLDANSTTDDKYWQFFPAAVRDNAAPVTRFVAFRGQYNSELTAAGQGATAADTTTKPNFFSGVANAGTEQAPVWVDWKGVFHPKTRSWSFYDDEMKPLPKAALETTVVSTVVAEAATATVSSTPGGASATATVTHTPSGTASATASLVFGTSGVTGVTVTSVESVGTLVGGTSGTYRIQYRAYSVVSAAWFLGTTNIGLDLSQYGLGVTGEPDVGDAIDIVYTTSGVQPITGVTVVVADFGTYVGGVSGTYVLKYDSTGWKSEGKTTYFTSISYTGTAAIGTEVTVVYASASGLSGAAVSASVFGEKVSHVCGTYAFSYASATGSWTRSGVTVNLAEYGITLQGLPNDGDSVSVAYTAPSGITGVTVDSVTYLAKTEGAAATNVFTKVATGWTLSGAAVDLDEYGIEVDGYPAGGNTITVEYGGEYAISYASGTYTLTLGAKTATQTGRATSIWHDYGVYFVKGSGTGGTFPGMGIVAVWA